MGLIYAFIASLLAAAVNFCFRKNGEKQASPGGYLMVYFLASFLLSFLAMNVSLDSFRFVMPSLGALTGMLNFAMMLLLSHSLQLGPTGLTFAFQNSASMFPAFILALIFGSTFGFQMTLSICIGFGLIALGLFLASLKQKQGTHSSFHRWLFFAIATFLVQGTILSLFQWRCLLLSDLSSPLIPWKCSPQEDAWFMPSFFLIPALIQTAIFSISERRWLSVREFILGMVGGLLNGGSTYFLLQATKMAQTHEKMILFPFFAVSVILLCHVWAKLLYKESIYWPGMLLCIIGVLIGGL